jgi:hypothetical protein
MKVGPLNARRLSMSGVLKAPCNFRPRRYFAAARIRFGLVHPDADVVILLIRETERRRDSCYT